MGHRGELYSSRSFRENRSYFFNVKENRMGQLYLNLVESTKKETDFDRHQIMVYDEDIDSFVDALEQAVSFIKKERFRRHKQAKREGDAPGPSEESQPAPRRFRKTGGNQGEGGE